MAAVVEISATASSTTGMRPSSRPKSAPCRTIASQAIRFSVPDATLHPVLVDGTTGVFIELAGRPLALMVFTVVDDRVAEIDIINDPDRLTRLGLLDG